MSYNDRIKAQAEIRKQKLLKMQKRHYKQAQINSRRMRKMVKFFTSKPVIYIFLLIIQLALMIAGFFMLDKFVNTYVVLVVFGVFSYGFAIYIINSNIPIEYKIVWVFIVLALTVFGMVAYLIFGKKKISKRKMARIRGKIDSVTGFYKVNHDIVNAAEAEDVFLFQTANFIHANCGLSLQSADEITYFDIGEKYFDRLKIELLKAQKFIFLEFFVITKGKLLDEIFGILKSKAQGGVEVRITYDDLGCLTTLPRDFGKNCAAVGIKLYCFNRLRPILDVAQNNRTHRKFVIIDGNCAFTGGVNLADEYANIIEKHGHWKDIGMMLKGRAVENFTLMFLTLWAAKFGEENISDYLIEDHNQTNNEQAYCQPFFDMPGSGKAICEQLYIKMIYEAKKYIYINTPYLIISDKMKHALICAAESGVDVRITVPHIPDKKIVFGLTQAFYTPLVNAGIKIFQYKPGFIHAKSIIIDDKYAVIGTSNMDFRSFYLHYECNVFIYKSICEEMRLDYEKTCELSILITKEQTNNYPIVIKIWRAFLRILAPLM